MKLYLLILFVCLWMGCDTKSNVAPTVEFVSPVANGVVSGKVTLSAVGQAFTDASSVNRVEKVLMLVNRETIEATRQSSGIKPRFTYLWDTTTLADGNYNIQASVTDTEKNTGRSEPILIKVENGRQDGPQTFIQTPTSGESLAGQVAVVAVPTENQPALASVEIVIDGISVATVSSSPYVYRWETNKFYNGTHTLQSKAKGIDGKIRLSLPIQVTTIGGL